MHNPKCTQTKRLSCGQPIKLGGSGGNVFLSTAIERQGQFQLGDHEIHQMLPTLKEHIAGQGPQVIEEGFADPEFGAQQFVFGIQQVQNGVEEKGQQIEVNRKAARCWFPCPKLCSKG